MGTVPYLETHPLSPDLTHILNEDLYLETLMSHVAKVIFLALHLSFLVFPLAVLWRGEHYIDGGAP